MKDSNGKMTGPEKAIVGLVGGLVGGVLFYHWSEASIPTKDNCSYLASPATDAAAFGLGSYAIYRGYKGKDWFLSFLGAAIASTHAMQYAYHKGGLGDQSGPRSNVTKGSLVTI